MSGHSPLPEPDQAHDGKQPVKTWMLVVSALLVAVSAFMCLWMVASAPAFGEMFAGFGADLPTLTRLVLATSKFTPVLILLTLVPFWPILRNRHDLPDAIRHFWYVVAGFVVTWVVLGVFVAGIYLPIIKMGSVV